MLFFSPARLNSNLLGREKKPQIYFHAILSWSLSEPEGIKWDVSEPEGIKDRGPTILSWSLAATCKYPHKAFLVKMRFEGLGKWIDGCGHQMMIQTIREKNMYLWLKLNMEFLLFGGQNGEGCLFQYEISFKHLFNEIV